MSLTIWEAAPCIQTDPSRDGMPCHLSSVYVADASHHKSISLDLCSPKAGSYRNITFRIGPEPKRAQVKLHEHGPDYLVT